MYLQLTYMPQKENIFDREAFESEMRAENKNNPGSSSNSRLPTRTILEPAENSSIFHDDILKQAKLMVKKNKDPNSFANYVLQQNLMKRLKIWRQRG